MCSTNTFINGIISGYIGAFFVYPIDLVKTRLQNQNTNFNGIQCIKNIIRNEGYKAFYKGSLIQLMGVGPEKALKLQVSNFVSSNLEQNNYNKIISGSLAGASQVLVTNPIERIKIQYQMNMNKSILNTIKNIGGFTKLYKGSSLCLLRDIPFSAIYFPTYDYLQRKTNNIFLSAMIAGIPAAYLVTPADVIKTRIQTNNNYKNIGDCIRKTYKNEGFNAFWKGGLWRVFKSSPQFGITLWLYEFLNSL
jgi:solute carrier family 25 (mitochondrial aspartate/glutamate transporter), member 12/13